MFFDILFFVKLPEPVHCGSSVLKAAQDKSKRKAALDETGFEYCVCRHGVAQKGLNMYRGEIFGYAHFLQKNFMLKKKVLFMWYDVICKYWVWLQHKDPFMIDQMKPALSVMHGKLHEASCQVNSNKLSSKNNRFFIFKQVSSILKVYAFCFVLSNHQQYNF